MIIDIKLKEKQTIDETQLSEALKINNFSGCERIIESFPKGTFHKGLELFCGRGHITAYLHTKVGKLTCLDINRECEKNVWRFKNVSFIPIDSLKLVKDHYNELHYDLIHVDSDTCWIGEGIKRFEFYAFLPELLKMVKNLVVFTLIVNPRNKDFEDYLKRFSNTYMDLIEDIVNARKEFFDCRGEYITDECLEFRMNKAANIVGKKATLLLREPRTPLRKSHEHIYFKVENN